MRYGWILFVVFILGCDGSETDDSSVVILPEGDVGMESMADTDPVMDTDSPAVDADLSPQPEMDAGPPVDMMMPEPTGCDIEPGAVPDGVTVIEFHDGEPLSDVSQQTWSIVDEPVADAVLNESVAFELLRPARVVGYAVMYGALPEDEDAVLRTTLNPDFGYNGFDFWARDPLSVGERCRKDVQENEWVEFILPEPVDMPDPGLVYVSHQRESGGAAFAFDGTAPTPDCTDDCCNPFGACHSAWNFPRLRFFESGGQQNYAYNGLSLTFRYDYMVRLYVEYTDEISPEETLFTRVPEVELSNRLAWGDYDNDGDEDLLVNGPRLLRNDDGNFVDVTAEAGLDAESLIGTGIFGDYDNDGCLDIFLFDEAYTRSDHLLRSDCSGGFDDVTALSGIADVQEYMTCDGGDRAPTPAAGWVDIDADGFLDLYLANFICWSSGDSYLDTVYRSLGDGRFEEWTGIHGFASLEDEDVRLASRGVLPADYDGDGDVDILANTYRLNRNLYYRNDGDGEFTEVGEESGLAGRPYRTANLTYYGHAIGATIGDLDGDLDLDLVIANLAHPRFFDFSNKTAVMINQGNGRFRDIQGNWNYPHGEAGIRFQETHSIPTLGDFDNNGTLDLAISAIYDGRPSDFYWGNGDGTFTLDAWRSGLDVRNGWGQAAADYDQDGQLDLATSHGLFRNQRVHDGSWLQTRVVGINANRAGIGATVFVEAGEITIMRVIGGGTGQGCQDSLSPHYGLGEQQQVDRVRVRFPGAASEVVYEGPFAVNQRLWLYEDGSVERGWNADW